MLHIALVEVEQLLKCTSKCVHNKLPLYRNRGGYCVILTATACSVLSLKASSDRDNVRSHATAYIYAEMKKTVMKYE